MGRIVAVYTGAGRHQEAAPCGETQNNIDLSEFHGKIGLLCYERLEELRKQGKDIIIENSEKNLLIKGIDVKTLPVGMILRCKDVALEITDTGKPRSYILEAKDTGNSEFPQVFAKVLKGGTITVGDDLYVCE